MELDEKDVARLAGMARLALGDDERAGVARALGDIVSMMEVLKQADVGDDDPMAHVGLQAELGLRGREDAPQAGIDRKTLLANAPQTRGDLFAVPKVIE